MWDIKLLLSLRDWKMWGKKTLIFISLHMNQMMLSEKKYFLCLSSSKLLIVHLKKKKKRIKIVLVCHGQHEAYKLKDSRSQFPYNKTTRDNGVISIEKKHCFKRTWTMSTFHLMSSHLYFYSNFIQYSFKAALQKQTGKSKTLMSLFYKS